MSDLIAELASPGIGVATYVLMGVLVFIGACLQGIGGIGFSMFAAPLAVLAAPVMVPGPLLLLGAMVSLMAAWRERGAIAWPVAWRCIGGRCVGAVLAAAVVVALPGRALAAAFGLLLLGGVGLSAAGWKVAATPRNAWLAGTLSGVMGTITSAGAPPLGLLTQHMAPSAIRATVGSVIALGAVASLVMLGLAGQFDRHHAVLGVALVPWILAGFQLSNALARRISAAGTRRLLLLLVTGSALVVLGKALVGP